jgi:hypothetical protein
MLVKRHGTDHTHVQGPVDRAQGHAGGLGLQQGDQLNSELEGGTVPMRSVAPLELVVLWGLEANLAEWSIQADEDAFADL